jgi:hypothetical protein
MLTYRTACGVYDQRENIELEADALVAREQAITTEKIATEEYERVSSYCVLSTPYSLRVLLMTG